MFNSDCSNWTCITINVVYCMYQIHSHIMEVAQARIENFIHFFPAQNADETDLCHIWMSHNLILNLQSEFEFSVYTVNTCIVKITQFLFTGVVTKCVTVPVLVQFSGLSCDLLFPLQFPDVSPCDSDPAYLSQIPSLTPKCTTLASIFLISSTAYILVPLPCVFARSCDVFLC